MEMIRRAKKYWTDSTVDASLCFKSNTIKKRLASLFENVLVVALRVGEYITCKYDNCNHDMNFHHHCGNYCKSSSRNYQPFL